MLSEGRRKATHTPDSATHMYKPIALSELSGFLEEHIKLGNKGDWKGFDVNWREHWEADFYKSTLQAFSKDENDM